MTPTRGQVLRSRAALLASVLALIVGAFYVLPLAVPTAFKEAGESGSLRLKELRTLHSDYELTRLAWHPNNRELAVGQSLHRKITIWNTDTGQVIRVLDKEVGSVGALAYSPDGKYLAVGRDFVQIAKPHLHLYDAASGELVRSFMPPQARRNDAVLAVAFSPDSRRLAWALCTICYDSGGDAGVVYDLPSGTVVATLGDGGHMLDVLAVSPDGHAEQERLKDTERMSEIHSLAFSPDGRWLAVGRKDRSGSHRERGHPVFDSVSRIQLWETASWTVARQTSTATAIASMAFSPDGQYLAVDDTVAPRPGESAGGKVQPYNDGTAISVLAFPDLVRENILPFYGPDPETGWRLAVLSLAYSGDGRLLVSSGYPVKVIDAKTGAMVQEVKLTFMTTAHFTAMSKDGSNLAVVSEQKIRLYELMR